MLASPAAQGPVTVWWARHGNYVKFSCRNCKFDAVLGIPAPFQPSVGILHANAETQKVVDVPVTYFADR
jgi:hypothetical protein